MRAPWLKKPLPGLPFLVAAPIDVSRAATLSAWAARPDVQGTRVALGVRGDSMNRSPLQNGFTASMEVTRTARHGDLVAVNWPEGGTGNPLVKRLVVTASGDRWIVPESDNPRYMAFKLHPRSQIIGVVYAVQFNGTAPEASGAYWMAAGEATQ